MLDANTNDKLTDSSPCVKCNDKSVNDKRKIFKESKQNKIEPKSENISGLERLKQLQERDIAYIEKNLEIIGDNISSIQQRMDCLDRMFGNIR